MTSQTTELVGGPYTPPGLRRGDRATCLYRDGDVVITSWTNARISWPRCQRPRQSGGSGLLVDEELLRAIRTESAAALKFWFGVGTTAVWNWRKAFGVAMWATEGSKRLHQQLSSKGAGVLRGKKLSPGRVRLSVAGRKAPYVRPVALRAKDWRGTEIALLGKMPDELLAKRLGRPVNGVRLKRTRLGIRTFEDRRRKR